MFGWKALLLAVAIVGVGALSVAPWRAYAAQGTLRVDPAVQSVGSGAEFEVKIIQNADVATVGAQASVRFDPAVIEVVGVEVGAPYASAQLVTPGSIEQTIADANSTGLLACIATFFVPGSGSIPPGDADFLSVTFRSNAGGSAALALTGEGCGSNPDAPMEMLDENGSVIPVTGTGGSVTISGAPPVPGVTPPPTATPAGTPTVAVATVTKGSPVTGATSGTPAAAATSPSSGSTAAAGIRFEPAVAEAGKGESFDIEVKHNLDVPISGVAVQIRFRKEVAELAGIEPGSVWAKAQGASKSELDLAVDQAQSGDIEVTFQLQGGAAPAGDSTLMTLKMTGSNTDATAPVAFISVTVTDADGNIVNAKSEGGQIVIGSGGGGRNTAATLTLGMLLLLAIGGTGGGAYFMVQRRRRQWA